LLYAQVVKQGERGEVIAVSTKVVFGDAAAIQAPTGGLADQYAGQHKLCRTR